MPELGELVSTAALIDRLAAIHRATAEAALGEIGVLPSLTGVLWLLEQGPADPSMKEVALSLGCDPSYVSLLAGQLETSGLAERVVAGGDARARVLRLTPQGSAAALHMLAAVATASPLATLPAGEMELLGEAVRAAVGSVRAE